jgi:2'-5' RNA ligase
MIRTFLAVEIPRAPKDEVRGLIQTLARTPSKVKWVSPDQVHLTLKFFGSVPLETVDLIKRTLAPVITAKGRFRLTLKDLGGFPNLVRPRVIWLGLGGDLTALTELYKGVEEALAAVGIPREDRPFKAHLTLGRNKAPAAEKGLVEALKGTRWQETAPFDIEQVILYRSDLKPSGPIYTPLQVFPLKEDGGARANP